MQKQVNSTNINSFFKFYSRVKFPGESFKLTYFLSEADLLAPSGCTVKRPHGKRLQHSFLIYSQRQALKFIIQQEYFQFSQNSFPKETGAVPSIHRQKTILSDELSLTPNTGRVNTFLNLQFFLTTLILRNVIYKLIQEICKINKFLFKNFARLSEFYSFCNHWEIKFWLGTFCMCLSH